MNNLEEQMAKLDMNPIMQSSIPEYLKSPIITAIFQDGLDIYKPEDKWIILGVPNVFCNKYFDDEDFVYARLKFSESLEDELDLNPEHYLIIHNLTINSLDLSLNPNTIFAKILYLFQHSQIYYTSLRHLRPLDRAASLPSEFLAMVNNTVTIIRYLLDNNLFNYIPNELIPEEMFQEFSYGLNLVICHTRLICNYYYLNNQQELKDMDEKHLKKIMRMVNNMCVIMIYFKLAF
jgi:hypothetical protein